MTMTGNYFRLYAGVDFSREFLCHYGVGHNQGGHSGRYPWGSGKSPKQDLKESNRSIQKGTGARPTYIIDHFPIDKKSVSIDALRNVGGGNG